MLRRSTSSTSAHMQRSLRVTRSSDVCSALALCSPSRSFFDNLKKQLSSMGANATKDTNNSSSSTSSNSSSSGGSTDSKGMPQMPPGFPGGFNAQQMQTLQQLFNSQPKEKQEQLLKQAMEMQKMMGKVPGLGKMAQKNAAMMEQMLKMTSAATAGPAEASMQSTASSSSSPHTASSSSSSANGPSVGNRRDLFKDAAHASANAPRSGPSLDELKKVNLGPEIEALFAELRTIRARKNEYRDKFHAAQAALARLQQDHGDLVTREASVRGKLSKAEQEVMLLTSENMELRDSSKSVKQLTQANKQLRQEVERLRAAAQASAAPGTASYATLKQQHQATEDAMRSLQRKVDRMRRRDPLLQFSLACSDVSRLCATVRPDDTSANAPTTASNANSNSSSATASSHNAVASQVSERSQEAAEQAFSALQSSYYTHQRQAWAQAAQEHGAAAAAYVAVVRRFVMTRVPYSHYDAAVTFTGDRARLQATVASVGFHLEAIPGETNKVHILAAADAETPGTQPGPYGYAFALRMATTSAAAAAAAGATTEASFAVTAVQPFVSSTLVQNAKRSVVVFETARASGPGGQATNVTETQVYAKLSIDGVAAFTAEAQDSRSALSNKEAALEKLQHQRRQQYNDTLAKQERADAVQSQLIELVQSQGGLTVEDDVAQLVTEAAAAKEVEAADAALVAMMRELGRAAAAAPGGQSS